MFLRDCYIENVGPIARLDLQPGFDAAGLPKPLVLVGGNGSGKTVLLSHIADAYVELAKKGFSNVVASQPGLGQGPFFKVTGPSNQAVNSDYAVALLEFSALEQSFGYVDKTGTLEPAAFREKLGGRFASVQSWQAAGNYKKIAGLDGAENVRTVFGSNTFCYFPITRSDPPHWSNESARSFERFTFASSLEGTLEKPLIVESCSSATKAWILDIVLDGFIRTGDVVVKGAINQLLAAILGKEAVRIGVGPRGSSIRLAVTTRDGKVLLPSLDNLSAGQSQLFYMFATIVRYGEAGLQVGQGLGDIRGLVVIDEIDAHLHSDMQHDILPKLIKLFPRVQFILSSHAPLFLLGMEREFRSDGIDIAEMPSGKRITSERFSEFERSYEYLRTTKKYEEVFSVELDRRVRDATRDMVLCEGSTDACLITTALEVLGRSELLAQLEIQAVGVDKQGGTHGGGSTALDNANRLLQNAQLLGARRVLLLYDFDKQKTPVSGRNVWVRSIPRNTDNGLIRKGIENRFPLALFDRGNERIYRRQPSKEDDYGAISDISNFDKKGFCAWICERRQADDFIHFLPVVELLEAFVDVTSHMPIEAPRENSTVDVLAAEQRAQPT